MEIMKMEKEIAYPIIIKMNSKEIQIGSAKVEFEGKNLISVSQRRSDVILKNIKLNFKEGDWIANVLFGC